MLKLRIVQEQLQHDKLHKAMSNQIPQAFIIELLTRIDIVEIIAARIKLKKTGANFNSLCPFHTESTPSFTVSATKQFYHCFGCGAHGTAISFLMNYDRMEFRDAIENLAQMAGLAIPDEIKKSNSNSANFDSLFQLLSRVSMYYQAQLKQSKFAIDYLKNRGLTGEIAKRYALGYAPHGWENLIKYFGKNNSIEEQLIISGMLIKKNPQQLYERFHSRIMFPIRNIRGQIIGFGGRTLNNELPKYLNSPETPIFHKGHELYGLYEALQTCKKFEKLIIVEGYMDVVALAQFGIHNVVATLGTAISEKHLQRLLRFCNDIIFCFDGDNAGKQAAWRALEIALPLMRDGICVAFIFLPQKDDPDSFIRNQGKNAFLQLIEKAQPLSEFFFEHLCSQTNLQTTDGKAKLAALAKRYLEKMPRGIFQQLMLEKLSQYIGIQLKTETGDVKTTHISINLPTHNTKVLSAIKFAILALLQEPNLAKEFTHFAFLKSFQSKEASVLFQLLEILTHNPHLSTGALLQIWHDNKEAAYLAKLAAYEYPTPKEGLKTEFLGAVRRIIEQGHEQLIQALLDKAKQFPLTEQEKKQLQQLIAEKQATKL